MSAKANAARASAVSRFLKTKGVHTVPSGYKGEGVRVTTGVLGETSIDVVMVSRGQAVRLAEYIRLVLIEGGYAVRRNSHVDHILYAKKEG